MARIIYGGRARLLTQSQQMWYNPLGDLDPSLIHAWQAITGDGRTIPDYATSLIDIAAGTQPLLDTPPVVTAPDWDAVDGWGCDGGAAGTKALRTGFALDVGCAMFVRFSGATTNEIRRCCGAMTQATLEGMALHPRYSSGQRMFWNGALPWVNVVGNPAAGVLAVVAQQGYYNGAASGGALPAYVGAAPADCGIGGWLAWDTPSWQGGGKYIRIQLVAFYHAALIPAMTLAHIVAISARMVAVAP